MKRSNKKTAQMILILLRFIDGEIEKMGEKGGDIINHIESLYMQRVSLLAIEDLLGELSAAAALVISESKSKLKEKKG